MYEYLLMLAGAVGGFEFNRFVKKIDYLLGQPKTGRDEFLEGLVDVVHHAPIWFLVMYFALCGWFWFEWLNILVASFAFGNIISDFPELVKRIAKILIIMRRYININNIKTLISKKPTPEVLTEEILSQAIKEAEKLLKEAEKEMNGDESGSRSPVQR